MSTALQIMPQGAPLSITNEQLALAKSTVAKGLDDNQFALFLYNCQRQGIHPLDGLLIPVPRVDNGERKLTFVTTVDLLRSRAAETNEYAGSDDAIFEYDGERPKAATVTVWRFVQGEKCSFTATARYSEYFPGEKQGFMWKSKPHVMLGKCAEGLALRKAFPKQLAGLYLAEELDKDDSIPQPIKNRGANRPTMQSKPFNDKVSCASCGKINSHDETCKYHPKNQSGTGQPPVQGEVMPKKEAEVPKSTTQESVMVKAVTMKPKKKGPGEFAEVIVTTEENKEGYRYAFGDHVKAALSTAVGKLCVWDISRSGDFLSVETIHSVGTVAYVNNEPVQAPTAAEVGFDPSDPEEAF